MINLLFLSCFVCRRAATDRLNIHSNKPAPKHRIIDSTKRPESQASKKKAIERANEFFTVVEPGKRHAAVVDFCLSASRFKIFLPSFSRLITLGLAGMLYCLSVFILIFCVYIYIHLFAGNVVCLTSRI